MKKVPERKLLSRRKDAAQKKGRPTMKKPLTVFLALLLVMLPLFVTAQESPDNTKLTVIEVKNVVPEDETEEVVPPTVQVVPDTPEIKEMQEDLQTIFRLTIFYVYTDGRRAAPTYSSMLQTGTEYNVPSPEIKGYTPSIRVVSGVMPSRDIEYTVVYFSEEEKDSAFPYTDMPVLYDLVDYEAPTGLGFSISNVGICFE